MSPELQRSAPGFWWHFLGPAVFAIWVILYFQGEVRGASFSLQMLLFVPAVIAGWLLFLSRSLFQRVADDYHQIFASIVLGAAFFAIWALGTVPMEEIYLVFDGSEGRRIYSDDSGMGYPIGPRNALAVTGAASICGLVFGFAWGVVAVILRKIPCLANHGRNA